MAYARTAIAPRGFIAAPRKPGNWRGLLRRLGDALEQSHQRALDREIAAYLQSRGGKLTDRAERDIERMMYVADALVKRSQRGASAAFQMTPRYTMRSFSLGRRFGPHPTT